MRDLKSEGKTWNLKSAVYENKIILQVSDFFFFTGFKEVIYPPNMKRENFGKTLNVEENVRDNDRDSCDVNVNVNIV